jgi:hypothetical protein
LSEHAQLRVVTGTAGAAVSGAFSTRSHTVVSAEATPIMCQVSPRDLSYTGAETEVSGPQM